MACPNGPRYTLMPSAPPLGRDTGQVLDLLEHPRTRQDRWLAWLSRIHTPAPPLGVGVFPYAYDAEFHSTPLPYGPRYTLMPSEPPLRSDAGRLLDLLEHPRTRQDRWLAWQSRIPTPPPPSALANFLMHTMRRLAPDWPRSIYSRAKLATARVWTRGVVRPLRRPRAPPGPVAGLAGASTPPPRASCGVFEGRKVRIPPPNGRPRTVDKN